MKRIILPFALCLFACGDQEAPLGGSAPLKWTHSIHQLSPTPGECYVPPPPVVIPDETSYAYASQVQRGAQRSHATAMSCITRFEPIIQAMRDDPDAPEWNVTHRGVHYNIIASDEPIEGAGRFLVQTSTIPPGFESSCPVVPKAYGMNTENYTFLDNWGAQLIWNDFSVTAIVDYGIIRISLYHRGCDPETGVSFGSLPSYDFEGDGYECWNKQGVFVDCEGVNIWPYEPEDQ